MTSSRIIAALFPRRPLHVVRAYAPAIALSFVAWFAVLRWIDVPLARHSRWYRSLPTADRRFVRAYIVRSLWAIQAVLTSVRAQDLRLPLLPRDTLFAAERADRVQGWSRVDDVLYPMTLGFALLENWVELWHNYREYREARRKHRDEWETVDLDDFDTVEGGVCVGADAHDSFSHIGESKENDDLQTVPASPKTTTRNHASVPLPSTSQTRTRPPPPPPAYNPSLLIHHLLFFLVEFHTFRTRSLAYFGNILKFWEATAPISFAVWVSQRRKAWRDAEKKAVADVQGRAATPDPLSVETCSDSDGDGTASTRSRRGSTSSSRSTHSSQSNASIDATRLVTTAAATTTTTTTAPRHNLPFTIGSQRTLRHLTLLRIIIWILVRTVFDAHFLRQLYRDGLLPWGRNAHRLNFGNKVQLWLAAPVFWFGLNPLWLWGAIQSYIRLRNKERVAKTEAEARTAKEEVSVNVSNEVVAPLKVEKNIDRTTRAKSVLHTHGDGLAKRRRVFAAVATADSEFTVKE